MPADKSRGNVLFVVLPNKETLTTRGLPKSVTVDYLRAKLELATGIHGNAIHLVYGEVALVEDIDLNFGDNLRNGGLMKLLVADQLLDLYHAVCASDVQNVIGKCLDPEDAEQSEKFDSPGDIVLSTDDRKFFSLLLACKQGCLEVTKALFEQDSEGLWRKQCTRFRRTLAHVAAASDQTKTLEFLFEQEAPTQTTDCFSNTPLDVAIKHGAYACERLIRQTIMRKKSARRQRADKTTTTKKSGSKVCWKDNNKENSVDVPVGGNSVAKLYGMMPLDAGVVCGTPLVSSRRTSANGPMSSPQVRPSQTVDMTYKNKSPSKSASPDRRRSSGSKTACGHRRCAVRPPFMAFRSVPQEELRPVTVEYIPLPISSAAENQRKARLSSAAAIEQRLHQQHDYPKAPCSSLNNSTEDLVMDGVGLSERELMLQKRNEVMKRYTKVTGITSRAQSAKYYRTKYHLEAECDASIPKPRPSTAGPRYREWKTWLLDQMEMEAQKEKTNFVDVQRRKLNELAYRKWLARHRKFDDTDRVSVDDESSEDEEDRQEARLVAYQMWVDSKKTVFEEMDKRRREVLNDDAIEPTRCLQRDRRLAVFEIGACIDEPAEPSKPDRYIRAYQTWIRNKKNYENWKRRNGLSVDEKTLSKEEFVRARDSLLMEGMTYNEWLGLKAREQTTNKLHLLKL